MKRPDSAIVMRFSRSAASTDAAHARDEVLLVVLHVGEHLGHRVALDHVLDAVVVAVDPDVHGVGVAEEVVQVAQDLLVGADQEGGDQVLAAVRAVQLEEALHVAQVDELVDLAVAVAGEVGDDARGAAAAWFRRWIGIVGKSCFTAQWSGIDWKSEKLQ